MSRRSLYLQHEYGITEEDYQRMLEAQGGRCYICQKMPRKGAHLSVDHDHKTKRVRGLLCTRCNRALGPFEWDIGVIVRTISYLQAILNDRMETKEEPIHV